MMDVQELNIHFAGLQERVHAVRNVSFQLGHEKVAIVGESGSGKTQVGRALLGLSAGQVTAKRLHFKQTNLLTLSQRDWRKIRGQQIAMVMQDPKYSLNPIMTIEQQMREALFAKKLKRRQQREKILSLLEAVKIHEPERVMRSYPHEVSGGMGQRIMIAMMLLAEPELLIADEPTSALDVTVQLEVLAILDQLMQQRRMGLLFISHDLNLVASFCDRILVMYGGQIVEQLIASELHQAQHPYTQGLLACLPTVHNRGKTLPTLQRDASWLERI